MDPVKLAGLGCAAAAVVAVRVLKTRPDRRFVVVDAGSGSTRATFFGSKPGGGVTVLGGPTRIDARVCESLGGKSAEREKFASGISKAIVDMGARSSVPVYVGCTGGAREALRRLPADSGDPVQSVRDALRAALGRSVELEIMQPDQEGLYELRAVEHLSKGAVGVLSGGGASMQIGLLTNGARTVRSVALDTYGAQRRIEAKGASAAMMYEWEVRKRITNSLIGAKNPALGSGDTTVIIDRFTGEFACIELAAECLRKTLNEDELSGKITRARLLEALEERKKELLPKAKSEAQTITYVIQTLALVDLAFAKDATFFLLEKTAAKPSWPLGLYLHRRDLSIRP